MNISERRIKDINNFTSFSGNLIEKVLRLEDLLKDIFRHPYLRNKFLLKGGTALNFCYFNKSRLSVDIDLNYVGSIDMETMKKERLKAEEAIIKIVHDKGYIISGNPGEEHAGGKWSIVYTDLSGNNENLEFDINYLYRVPIGKPNAKNFKAFDDSGEFEILTVSTEELFAGKVVAVLDRSTPRDIYDLVNIQNYSKPYNCDFFRKAVILLGASRKKDFRKMTAEKLESISDRDIESSLYPLLSRKERISREKLLEKAIPFVSNLLNFTAEEKEFLDRYLDNAEYKPDILFHKYPDLIPKLEKHPSLLWKKLNVERYLAD
ncbi:MAG: nucleotidyl transferase AbiEii/AbiGii toxin family protein [Armatimonadota bacterium]